MHVVITASVRLGLQTDVLSHTAVVLLLGTAGTIGLTAGLSNAADPWRRPPTRHDRQLPARPCYDARPRWGLLGRPAYSRGAPVGIFTSSPEA